MESNIVRLKYKDHNKTRKLAILFIVVFIFAYYVWLISFKENSIYLTVGGNIFHTVAPIIAGVWGLIHYYKIEGRLKYFWLVSSLAAFSNALGMLIYTINQIFLEKIGAYTGIADILWLLCILLYFVALVRLMSFSQDKSKIIQYIFDIAIVMVVATSFSWHLIIRPILNFSLEEGLLYTIVYVAYPIGTLGLLFAVLSLYYTSKKSMPKKVFLFNIIGFVLLLYANMLYMYLVVNDLYYTGSLHDPIWSLAILLLGLASFYSNESEEKTKLDKHDEEKQEIKLKGYFSLKLFLPYICVVTIYSYMLLHHTVEIDSIVIGSILATLLIIIRQIFTLVQNSKLLLQTQELNKQLEQKVKQRTEQLYHNNQELQETLKKVEHLAYYDMLTNLPNRRWFENEAMLAIRECKSTNTQMAIMFIDLDRFKLINDTLGHFVGDLLLKEVAKFLQKIIGTENLVSRQGGDEFIILIKNTNRANVIEIANQIIYGLQKAITVQGNELYISKSIGITMYPEHGENIDILIKRADIAMYSAKEQGKNSFQFFDRSMDDHIIQKMNLENGLRKAIEREELSLNYQPKLDLTTHQIIGVEALLRWKHPDLGYISPSRFIPIAEDSGLIVPLGDWVFRKACTQLKEWHDQGYSRLSLSVNVSSFQFLQKDFVDKVKQILDDTSVKKDQVELEITESIMHNTSEVISSLHQLKELGLKISVDDFGAGYSSLGHLKKLPIDVLKIDKNFIQDIHGAANDIAIVTTIITLGKNLGLKTIAEGVENEEQYLILKEKGCDQIQGYYISKPLPSHELEKKIFIKYNLHDSYFHFQ